ncbi:MAG TPA: archease [Gammaproteobacteria bacterium]|nr:archease [Gammaproteobacteria bacterium]
MKAASNPGSIRPHWEHFEHVADIGVRGYGETAEEAFANVAMAMTAVITEPEAVKRADAVQVKCEAACMDELLYAWLNSLVFEMATRHMLFSDFEIEIADGRLQAVARGEKVDRARHQPATEIKGATYTELNVRRGCNGGWVAQCVLDV